MRSQPTAAPCAPGGLIVFVVFIAGVHSNVTVIAAVAKMSSYGCRTAARCERRVAARIVLAGFDGLRPGARRRALGQVRLAPVRSARSP